MQSIMKKYIVCSIVLVCLNAFPQQSVKDTIKAKKPSNKWSFRIGANMVDARGPRIRFLGGLSHIDENAFNEFPVVIGIEKKLNHYLGLEGSISYNSWTEGEGRIADEILTFDRQYFSFDVMGKLYLEDVFKFSSPELEWLDLYGYLGVGYFNVNKGSMSINYGIGSSIWISNRIGLDVNVIYKNALSTSRFEIGHYQYSLGIRFRLSKNHQKPVEMVEKEKIPEKDTDGDMVPDSVDKCPNTPGFKENGGCPYKDTDKDGVIDKADYCPEIPGAPENNGCPIKEKKEDKPEVKEDLKETKKPEESKPQQSVVELSKKIKFESGNYNFTQDTYPYLIEVANQLIKEPETVRFRIIGHTDSVGSYGSNRILSRTRANAVRNYLVDKGISKDRIQTVGLGESKPIDTNLTREGRANNRRIEIIIIK